MKRLILSLSILFMALPIFCQELSVIEIKEITTDLRARTSPRYDLNGELCALVIVSAPTVKSIKFSGDIVGDVTYDSGLYTFYIPNGTKTIRFQHEDFLPGLIDFGASSIVPKKGSTYRVIMQGQGASRVIRIDEDYGVLIVTSSESLSTVLVDGENLGHTPLVIQQVEAGPHHVTVMKQGFVTSEQTISIEKGKSTTCSFLLEPEPTIEPEYDIPETEPSPEIDQPEKTKKPSRKLLLGIGPTMGYDYNSKDISYGGMIAYAQRFGGYAKFRKSTGDVSTSYSITSQNEDGLWLTGDVNRSRMAITGGAIIRIVPHIYPYAGIGYGERKYCVKSYGTEQTWAVVSDLSYSGFSSEAGIILKLGHLALCVGINTISFKYADLDACIMLSF